MQHVLKIARFKWTILRIQRLKFEIREWLERTRSHGGHSSWKSARIITRKLWRRPHRIIDRVQKPKELLFALWQRRSKVFSIIEMSAYRYNSLKVYGNISQKCVKGHVLDLKKRKTRKRKTNCVAYTRSGYRKRKFPCTLFFFHKYRSNLHSTSHKLGYFARLLFPLGFQVHWS